jgi:hypothetical protein
MKALTGATRWAFLVFFSSHILFSVLVDFQGLFPSSSSYYPDAIRQILLFHTDTFADPLMSDPPLWLRSFLWCELLFQWPFFFVACWMIGSSSPSSSLHYPDWFRCACIAYGAHAATTLVPILATLVVANGEASARQRTAVTAVYLPYLVFPLWILALTAGNPHPAPTIKKVD